MHRFVRLALPMTAALAVTAAAPLPRPTVARPTASIADVFVPEGLTATITVVLSEPATEFIGGEYRTGARTAKAGLDFVESSGIIFFDVGETVKTISVVTLDDDEVEGDEAFVVHVRLRGATVPGGPAKVTIIDND